MRHADVDDMFIEIMDDLTLKAEKDSELAEGLKWIDGQASRKGISFYEAALMILRKHMAEKYAKEWLRDKLNGQ